MAITGDPLQTDSNFSASVDLQEPLTSPLSEPIETASDVMNTLGVLDSTPPIPSPERFDQLDTAIAALGGEIRTTTVPDQLTGPTEVSNPPLLQSAIGQDAFLTHQPLALQQRLVLEDRPFSLELQSLVPEAQNLKQIQILNQEDGQPVDWLSYEWRLPDATLAEKVVIEGRFQDPSGDGVQLDVLVTDTRHNGQGLIGLELDLLWKSDAMELEQINLTPSLPLFRDTGNLDAAAGSLSGLVAASLPSSGNGEILGDSWRESFAQLNYRLLTNGEEGPDLTIIPRNYPARGNAALSAEQVVVVDSQSRPIPVLFGLAQQAQVGEHRLLLQAIDNSGRAWEQTLLLNVLNVNDSPKAIAIDPIEILEDEAFTINLADAFQDDDVSVGDSLTYQLSRGAPEWLVLDERSGLLSGQASNSEVDHWQIGVEAQDQSGATTQQTVKLVVINTNDAPLWNGQPLPEIWVRQDRPFEIRLPEQSISDVDAGDQLSYSLDLQNAEQLASLLTIDAERGTISGLIPAGETQLLNIKLVATDLAGESAAVPLRLKVVDRDFNRSPYRIGPELEQIILQEGDTFQLDYGVLFQDDDILIGDQLRFEVDAPGWLEVDPQRNRLSGSTDNDSVGEHRIRLKAIDQAGALAEKRFLLQVENSNQAPFYLDGAFDERRILINSDVWLEARDLFGDLDQIHSDKLSFGLQKNRESNLVFDPDTGELRFSPGEGDQGLHRLTLTATDRSGAISLYQLNLDVITADQKGGTKQSRGEDNLLSIEPRLYLSGSGERIRTEQLGTLPAGTQLSMRVELTDQRQSSLNPGVIGLDLDLHWTGLQLRQPADRPLDESITAVFPLFRQVDPSRLNENRLRFSAASLPELGLGEALGDQPAETFLVLDFELTDPSAPIRLDLMLNEESAGGLGLAMADGSDAARQLEIKSLSAQTLIDRLIREGQEKANRVRGVGIRIVVETSPSQSPSLRGESASALQLDLSGPSGPETRTAQVPTLYVGRVGADLRGNDQPLLLTVTAAGHPAAPTDETEVPLSESALKRGRLRQGNEPDEQGREAMDTWQQRRRMETQQPDDFRSLLRNLLEFFQHPASLAGLVITMMTMPAGGERGLRSLLLKSKLGRAIQLQRRNPELKAAWHLRLYPVRGTPMPLQLLIEHGRISLQANQIHAPNTLLVTRELDQQASLWQLICSSSHPGALLADVSRMIERVLDHQEEDLNWGSWLDHLAWQRDPPANPQKRIQLQQLKQSLLLAQDIDQAMADALMVSELLNCQVQLGLMPQKG